MAVDMDDELSLSSSTLAALQEFLKEKNEADAKFEQLKKTAHEEADKAAELAKAIDMDDFREDWQLSQFWYSLDTRQKLAQEALNQTGHTAVIGCISSPSAFVALKKMYVGKRKTFVFEFDKRFDVYGDEFVFYDFNDPLEGISHLKGSFDFLIVDPPFLSKECWLKTSQTVKYLSNPNTKLVICTGQVMGELINQELGCHESSFHPEHTNGLQNEFRCFINYQSSSFN